MPLCANQQGKLKQHGQRSTFCAWSVPSLPVQHEPGKVNSLRYLTSATLDDKLQAYAFSTGYNGDDCCLPAASAGLRSTRRVMQGYLLPLLSSQNASDHLLVV